MSRFIHRAVWLLACLVVVAVATVSLGAQTHTSKTFAGAKVNVGTVTHTVQGKKHVLTLSDDFKSPDTPDPHWQVVDSKGRVYLLDRLMLKGDKLSKTITLPPYVADVATVQIYCSWAEAVLGETTFDAEILTN